MPIIAPHFLQPFFALFGVVDPIGNVPVFLSLTKDDSAAERRRIALRAVTRAGLLMVGYTVAGSAVLSVFAISIDGFRIAGGLVFLLMGLQLVFDINFEGSKGEASEPRRKDVSIVPLATPMLAGPGTVAMLVVLVQQYGYALTLASIAVNSLLTLGLFFAGGFIVRYLGREGTSAVAKIMGIIIAAMGVEMLGSGLLGYLAAGAA
jgi:multiple antibiotic resistance protein